MTAAKTFEDLIVWQKAHQLVLAIYKLTKNFPKEEIFGLTSQFRRAAISVPANTCPVKQLEVPMYYTYVLRSLKDNGFYTGFTKNLKLRFEQHTGGNVESTKDRRPLELIYYEACLDPSDATKREKYLKSYHGKMFLRRRLESYLTG